MKRKEQVDKAAGNTSNARGGRGGRGGAVVRGGPRTMTRSYQSSMQTVSYYILLYFNFNHRTKNLSPNRIVTYLYILLVC